MLFVLIPYNGLRMDPVAIARSAQLVSFDSVSSARIGVAACARANRGSYLSLRLSNVIVLFMLWDGYILDKPASLSVCVFMSKVV